MKREIKWSKARGDAMMEEKTRDEKIDVEERIAHQIMLWLICNEIFYETMQMIRGKYDKHTT